MYWEDSIRNNTLDLLKTLLFAHNLKEMDEEERADRIYRVGRDLQKAVYNGVIFRCRNRRQLMEGLWSRSSK